MKKRNQTGFTMVEFLIATAVFSMVLLLMAYSIVFIGKIYFKGIATNRTQDASRHIVDDVASAIQFGRSDSPAEFMPNPVDDTADGVTRRAFCLGGVRYSFAVNAVLGDTNGETDGIIYSRHVLWRDPHEGACVPADLRQNRPTTDGQEMLSKGMRLPVFSVARPASADNAWGVSILVAYGDHPDLFTDASMTTCKGASGGGQFCAVSRYETSVYKRL